jgi:hypothetical protein
LPGLHVDLGDRTGVAAGHFDGGLVRFQLDDPLVLLDDVAFADQNFQNVAGIDPVAKVGDSDFDTHVTAFSSNGTDGLSGIIHELGFSRHRESS